MVGESVVLEYKMKKGEELTYESKVNSKQSVKEKDKDATSQVSAITMVMVQTAKAINPDGSIDVDVLIKEGKSKVGNEEAEIPNVGQLISMRMLKTGQITQSSVDIPFSQPPFPEKSMKKGDSWTGESKINIPTKPEPVSLFYNYSINDFKKVDGYECVEIKVSCPETKITLDTGVEQTISATGATYFAYKEGRLVKSEVETKTHISAEEIKVDNLIKVVVELKGEKGGLSSPDEGFIVR